MRRRTGRIYVTATLLIASVVAGATIAQAVREDSWEPILSVAWLPAVLVVTLRGSANTRGCLPRLRRRART